MVQLVRTLERLLGDTASNPVTFKKYIFLQIFLFLVVSNVCIYVMYFILLKYKIYEHSTSIRLNPRFVRITLWTYIHIQFNYIKLVIKNVFFAIIYILLLDKII